MASSARPGLPTVDGDSANGSSLSLQPYERSLRQLQVTEKRQQDAQIRKLMQMAHSFESRSKIEAAISQKATRDQKKDRALKEMQHKLAERNTAEAEAAQTRRRIACAAAAERDEALRCRAESQVQAAEARAADIAVRRATEAEQNKRHSQWQAARRLIAVRERAQEMQLRKEAEVAAREAAAEENLRAAAQERLHEEVLRHERRVAREAAAAAALQRKEAEEEATRQRLQYVVSSKDARCESLAAGRQAMMRKIQDAQKEQLLQQDRLKEAFRRMAVTGRFEGLPELLSDIKQQQDLRSSSNSSHRGPSHLDPSSRRPAAAYEESASEEDSSYESLHSIDQPCSLNGNLLSADLVWDDQQENRILVPGGRLHSQHLPPGRAEGKDWQWRRNLDDGGRLQNGDESDDSFAICDSFPCFDASRGVDLQSRRDGRKLAAKGAPLSDVAYSLSSTPLQRRTSQRS